MSEIVEKRIYASPHAAFKLMYRGGKSSKLLEFQDGRYTTDDLNEIAFLNEKIEEGAPLTDITPKFKATTKPDK